VDVCVALHSACVEVRCRVLQGVAGCCRVVQGVKGYRIAVGCSGCVLVCAWRCAAGCWRVLQGVAVCCNAVCCSAVQRLCASCCMVRAWRYVAVCCRVL